MTASRELLDVIKKEAVKERKIWRKMLWAAATRILRVKEPRVKEGMPQQCRRRAAVRKSQRDGALRHHRGQKSVRGRGSKKALRCEIPKKKIRTRQLG